MKASRDGEPFDLVLMDLQMAELDGIGAIRELRALGFDLPIVSLIAHAPGDDRERCLAAGSSGCETKPCRSSASAKSSQNTCGLRATRRDRFAA